MSSPLSPQYDKRRYYGHDHQFPPRKIYGEDFGNVKNVFGLLQRKKLSSMLLQRIFF